MIAALTSNCPASLSDTITLRVALYPFVPDQYSVFTLIAREFQRRNKGVTLELVEVDSAKDYYEDGLLTLDADVYEIDSILLSEMVKSKKIAALHMSMDRFTSEAIEAVTRDNAVYAVPHWLCGNFIFYRRSDTGVRDATTWAELLKALQREGKGLFVDFFGRLTLGEFYLTMLADRVGTDAAQASVIGSIDPDPTVVSDLSLVLSGCPTGFCRSKNLHERTGFYARAFARGQAGAYIGYSESLHYALQEILDDCQPSSGCASADEIAVRKLPSLANGSPSDGIGWVDGLAVAEGLPEAKKKTALDFLAFAVSADAYKLILRPGWMEAPRYLLPAPIDIDLSDGPLYPDLFLAQKRRKTGTSAGLNEHLRALSSKLNCALPIDRTDLKTATTCKIN
jgi:thiamine pyridinylase